jgi:hypothetical protein
MKTIFVIRDKKTKGYFWSQRRCDGFSKGIEEATHFDSEEQAVEQIQEEYLVDFFNDRVLEVRKFYIS